MSNNNAFWWLVLLIWVGGSTYWHVCKIKELCVAQPAPLSVSEKIEIPPLTIRDGHDFDVTANGNFGFLKSSQNPNFKNVKPELDSLVIYLASHPGKKLKITGHYLLHEAGPVGYQNLGIARAEKVKSYLMELGLPDSLLITNGEVLEKIVSREDSLFGGIDFGFIGPIQDDEIEFAQTEKFENVFKPMDLYFSSGSSAFIRTVENEKFLKEAVSYLKANKTKKLVLTGYTDSDGEEKMNEVLSRKRADSVKKEFISAGMDVGQLEVEGKGEKFPKESNDSEAGRKANRRVEIVVK